MDNSQEVNENMTDEEKIKVWTWEISELDKKKFELMRKIAECVMKKKSSQII